MVNIFQKFKIFLNQNKKNKDDKEKILTHTCMDGPYMGAYSFDTIQKYEEFYNMYTEIAIEHNATNLSFTERPHEISILYIDIDLKQIGNDRIYDDDMITEIVKLINDIISKSFDIDDEDYELYKCYVMEKNEPTATKNSDEFKDGIHIFYPKFFTNVLGRMFIVDKLRNDDSMIQLFNDMNYINTTEDIFDNSVIKRNGIMLIESTKKINGHKYYTTKTIYVDEDCDDEVKDIVLIDCDNDTIDLLQLMRPNICLFYEPPKIYELFEEFHDFDLINKNKEIQNVKNKIRKKMSNAIENVKDNKNLINNDVKFDTQIEDEDELTDNEENNNNVPQKKDSVYSIGCIKELIDVYSIERSNNYQTWMQVCWALKNIQGDYNYEEVFHHFSMKSNKYDEDECNNVWNDSSEIEGGYGVRSIIYWARNDNAVKTNDILYKYAIIDTKYDIYKIKQLDLGDLIYNIYKDQVICTTIHKNDRVWYKYNGVYWKEEADSMVKNLVHDFLVYLRNVLLPNYKDDEDDETEFIAAMEKLKRIAPDSANKAVIEREKRAKTAKKFEEKAGSIIDKFMNETYVSSLEAIFARISYQRMGLKFKSKLDQNNSFVGFKNGVFDIKKGIFRRSIPEDKISKTCGYKYNENITHDNICKNESYIEMMEFFRKIQIDDDMRCYLFQLLASCYNGGCDQQVYFLIGTGANGKSALSAFMATVLGDYYGTLPITVFTKSQQNSSNASPELAYLPGKRMVVSNEPEIAERLKTSRLKEMTSGDDEIPYRDLYKRQEYFLPKFKLFILCNNEPDASACANDGGSWRRFKVIPFGSTFRPSADDIICNENEFVAKDLSKTIYKNWRSVFTWFMLNKIFPEYFGNGCRIIKIPQTVNIYTENYRNKFDQLEAYTSKCIKKSGTIDSTITLSDLYDNYNQWFDSLDDKQNFMLLSKSTFQQLILKKMGINVARKIAAIPHIMFKDMDI